METKVFISISKSQIVFFFFMVSSLIFNIYVLYYCHEQLEVQNTKLISLQNSLDVQSRIQDSFEEVISGGPTPAKSGESSIVINNSGTSNSDEIKSIFTLQNGFLLIIAVGVLFLTVQGFDSGPDHVDLANKIVNKVSENVESGLAGVQNELVDRATFVAEIQNKNHAELSSVCQALLNNIQNLLSLADSKSGDTSLNIAANAVHDGFSVRDGVKSSR